MNALEVAAAASLWAQRNVGEKVLLFGGLLLLVISLSPWAVAPLVFAIAVVTAWIARVPMRLLAAMVIAPATFVLVGITPLLVSVSTDGIMWSPTGPQRAAEVVMRSIAGITCTMTFALTTPMSELLVWLERRGIPRSITYVAELTYRMTDSLIATARGMHESQARRLGHTTRRGMVTGVAAQSANLFIVAFARAQKLQDGLELRAEPGATRVLAEIRPVDKRFVVVSVGLLFAVLAVWAIIQWYVPDLTR